MVLLIAVGLLITLLMAAATVATLVNNAETERRMVETADLDKLAGVSVFARLDESLTRARWGQRLVALLAGAGLPAWSPSLFLTGTCAAAVAVGLAVLPLSGWATPPPAAGRRLKRTRRAPREPSRAAAGPRA